MTHGNAPATTPLDASSAGIRWAESGRLPDALVHIGIRREVRSRLRDERTGGMAAVKARYGSRLITLRDSSVALHTDAANRQHYEVPAAFFERVLGPHLKYSACFWPESARDLNQAEAMMLALYAERANLRDGQDVLDLGCGWGSLSLWLARRHPRSRITAVSNSASQREFIEDQARRRRLTNLNVITVDINALSLPSHSFDRVVSIEMFEHVRNYQELLRRISTWLRHDGALFVHIFCHRDLLYPYETDGNRDWMARHFFTGGLMPSVGTLTEFQEDLTLAQHWTIDGIHYAKTAAAWLHNMDRHRDEVRKALTPVYGATEVDRWVQRWRMFFMACEELFGYRDGTEWLVAHYLFKPAD